MLDLTSYWRTSPPMNEAMVVLLATKGIDLSRPPPSAEPSHSPSLQTEEDARRLADALNSLGVKRGE